MIDAFISNDRFIETSENGGSSISMSDESMLFDCPIPDCRLSMMRLL